VTSAAKSVVLLDAFGTLIGLRPPLPRLRRRLADAGYDYPDEVLAAALAAEMRFYRANHDAGRDAESLAELRRSCARVLGAQLGGSVPPVEVLTDCLMSSIEFVLLPDVLPTLDALQERGLRLAVVSNWDYELPVEFERLGVAERFEAVAVSASLGVGKPDPAIFRWALERLGAGPEEALHCGDHPEKDCAGARAAGIEALLLDRDDRHPDAPCPRIRTLAELPALLRP